jgi:hypothetical protein
VVVFDAHAQVPQLSFERSHSRAEADDVARGRQVPHVEQHPGALVVEPPHHGICLSGSGYTIDECVAARPSFEPLADRSFEDVEGVVDRRPPITSSAARFSRPCLLRVNARLL